MTHVDYYPLAAFSMALDFSEFLATPAFCCDSWFVVACSPETPERSDFYPYWRGIFRIPSPRSGLKIGTFYR